MPLETISRYRILAVIHEGPRATVYRAHDPLLDRTVAIKFMSATLSDAERDRLRRRLRTAGRLIHPNVVTVYELGEHEGRTFLATEYLHGTLLTDIIRRGVPILPDTLRLIEELTSAVAEAHRHDLVHGRLTPDNMMILADGTLKLMNLGLSLEEPPAGVTTTTGVADYWSPEQLEGREADPRSDIFSVGIIWYELITGRRPSPRDRTSGLADWTRTIARCVAPDPHARFQRMDELRLEIAGFRAAFGSLRGGAPADSVGAPLDSTRVGDSVRASPPMRGPQFPPVAAPARPAPARPPRPAPPPTDEAAAARRQRSQEKGSPQTRSVDENVQFSVYRPGTVVPQLWYPLLAFAHLAERRPDAAADEPDPVAEVQRQARQVLGDDITGFTQITADSRQAIPIEGLLRFVPRVAGIECNPPERAFLWLEPVHREEFRIRAAANMDGRTARGVVSVYLDQILVADVSVAIKVDSSAAVKDKPSVDRGRAYRRIFASYSHRDSPIVQQFEAYARGFGDKYMRDVVDLRAGEVWSERLAEMIDSADVFQLFWSWNAMGSRFVRSEWEHALSVRKDHFIRPLYWEEPFPERPGAPPEALRQFHFACVKSVVEPADSTAITKQLALPAPERRAAMPMAERGVGSRRPGWIVLSAALLMVVLVFLLARWC